MSYIIYSPICYEHTCLEALGSVVTRLTSCRTSGINDLSRYADMSIDVSGHIHEYRGISMSIGVYHGCTMIIYTAGVPTICENSS